MTRRNIWFSGIKDGIPICLGYFAVSFAFGIQAKLIGITAFQALTMSATNLTSAGQFAALGIIAANSSYFEMALTQIIINLRYCLMSCAIAQKLKPETPFLHRLGVAYGVTDEIFGVSVCKEEKLSPFYSYGLMTVAIPGWCFGTYLGVISGNFLPENIISALGIALYGMFIAVVVPAAKKDNSILKVVICAMIVSTLFYFTPILKEISSGFQIIIITLLIAGIAAWIFPVKEGDSVAS